MTAVDLDLVALELAADRSPCNAEECCVFVETHRRACLRVESARVMESGPLWGEPYRYWWARTDFPKSGVLSVLLTRDEALELLRGQVPAVVTRAQREHRRMVKRTLPFRLENDAAWRKDVSLRGRTKRDVLALETTGAGSPLQRVSKEGVEW